MAKVGIITKFLLFSKEFDQFWKYFPDDEIKVYFGDPDADTLDLLEAAEKDGCDALVTGAFTYERNFSQNISADRRCGSGLPGYYLCLG